MTAIAGYTDSSLPVLFGDLLISGPEKEDKKVIIPGIGDTEIVFPTGSGYTITGLKQKVCLVNDNLAIAWSGSFIAAASIIKNITKDLKTITHDSVKEYFDTLTSCKLEQEICLIAIFIDEETGKDWIIFKNADAYKSSQFGIAAFGGSGKVLLRKGIQHLETLDFKHAYPPTPFHQVVTHTAFLTSGFIAHDFDSNRNLLHYFGGGFETVTKIDRKLKKN
jgi:hypothetical protein